MPRTRRVLSKQNLDKLPILIQDSGVESTYFNIKQLSGVFTGGKNAFLISGTPLLKPGTEILIEMIDSSGNSVYVEAIRGFAEAKARLVVIQVYPETAPGSAILTIVGTASKIQDGKVLKESDTDKPNVRWQKKIIIEPRNRNITPIRLKKVPELYATEELLNPFQYSQSNAYRNDIWDITEKFQLTKQRGYAVKVRSPGLFVTGSRYYNSILTGSVFLETRQYTSSIPFTTSSYKSIGSDTASVNLPLTVINRTRATTNSNITSSISNHIIKIPTLMSGAYEVTSSAYSSSDGTEYYQTVTVITSSVLYEYTFIPLVTITAGKKSFVNFKLINLDTVSGELSRIKTSFRRAESSDDFAFLADTPLQVTELLVSASSNIYERQKPIGVFDDIAMTLQAYWYSYKITGSATPDPAYYSASVSSAFHYPLYANSNVIANSGYVSGSYDNYFFGSKDTFSVFSTSEYTLKFDALVTSSLNTVLSTAPDYNLDIYLIGSAIVDKDPLGKKIGNITGKATGISIFNNNNFNFTVPLDGNIGIRFVPKNGHWQFSNISMKVAEEYAFNPDEVTFLVPNQLITSASVVFKAELFDINNNAINLNVTSTPTYFTGSTV